MRFFSALPNQQRRRSTESGVATSVANDPDNETSERQRRRSTGEIHHRPSSDDAPCQGEAKIFMVVPVRLRDLDSNHPTCLICHEDYEVDCTISFLPCGHLYHSKCINGWLQRQSTCCVCRYELPKTAITRSAVKQDLRSYLKEFQSSIPENRYNSPNPLAETTTLTYKVS